MKVLFVCLGNICRSPTAEAVLRHVSKQHGVSIEVDSAGTAAYHVGHAPDQRSQQAAGNRGIEMTGLKARQVEAQDFYEFDYIFAMDKANLLNLKDIEPLDSPARLELFLEQFGSELQSEVPDPYYGDGSGFELVLDLLEDACLDFTKGLESK